MQWNTENISNKKTELENFLSKRNVNVFCIQETHLKGCVEPGQPEQTGIIAKPFKTRGYQTFRHERKDKSKGGILTLVRNNLNVIP